MEYKIEPIAYIKTDFPEKFGVPRQSGILTELSSKIIFEEKYRDCNAVRGLEDFDYVWLIWNFSDIEQSKWSPTVRPPKLGGNKRIGVFASRSPFRPNKLGLSSVKIEKIEYDKELGPIIFVSGADLVDGTPIFDIKPYLTYSDCHQNAKSGFSLNKEKAEVSVEFEKDFSNEVPTEALSKIKAVLSQDPHPSYKNDESRIYKMRFSEYSISFKAFEKAVTVTDITKI